MEKTINLEMITYLENFNIIYNRQQDFRYRCATGDLLAYVSKAFYQVYRTRNGVSISLWMEALRKHINFNAGINQRFFSNRLYFGCMLIIYQLKQGTHFKGLW